MVTVRASRDRRGLLCVAAFDWSSLMNWLLGFRLCQALSAALLGLQC
jgi:hypothetical protein